MTNENYGNGWHRVVVMVSDAGEVHSIGGDALPSNGGESVYPGFEILKSRLAASQPGEPPDHVIDVAVARIARDQGWTLPDTDLIEFGATVYKEALRFRFSAPSPQPTADCWQVGEHTWRVAPSGSAGPEPQTYTNRHGEPCSEACGQGRHAECTETMATCNCTYRGLHKTMHRYLTIPPPAESAAGAKGPTDYCEFFAELYQIAGVLHHAGLVPTLLLDKLSAATRGLPIPKGELLPFTLPELNHAVEGMATNEGIPQSPAEPAVVSASPCLWPKSGSCSCNPTNPNHTFLTAAQPVASDLEKCEWPMKGDCLQNKEACVKANRCLNRWPEASGLADKTKVEEIAEQIDFIVQQNGGKKKIAEFLGPFFTQVSQPPDHE